VDRGAETYEGDIIVALVAFVDDALLDHGCAGTRVELN
jgi:hypothetical protein